MAGPGAAGDAAPRADAYGAPLPFRFERLLRGLNALGTLWIVALAVLINADVIGRDLFAAPVRGVTELVSLSIVGIVFLQLGDTLHAGRFTRADLLLERVARSRPRAAARLHALYHVLGAALTGIILLAAWEPLVESIRIREYVGAVGDFTAPVWPVRVVILVGLVCTTLTFLMLAAVDWRRAGSLPARGEVPGRDGRELP